MVVVTRNTQRNATQVLRHAVGYFGPEGLGLKVQHLDAGSVKLQGAGGHVTVRVYPLQTTGMTTVEVECREWVYVAERFLGVI
jgi:hypothetical protein